LADIYWFPHAGGSSSTLVRPARQIRQSINLRVAVLPGREDRIQEAPALFADQLIDTFSKDISPTERPVILIGHSMGGSLAYRITQRLMAEQRPPALLTVVAATPPNRLNPNNSLNRLPDEQLLDELERHGGGIPPALREHPEALSLFLPTIRADLTLMDNLSQGAVDPVSVPLLAIAGQDDTLATVQRMEGWQSLTVARFESQVFPGNHFFPPQALPQIITQALTFSNES
jgi:medium-chain acyl-[acyl-carrier-protein] hydrolase